MAGKIAFLLCQHYQKEVCAALKAEKLDDVIAASFPARCGCPPLTGDELSTLMQSLPEVDQVELFGASCLKGLSSLVSDFANLHIHKLEHCFQLMADPVLIESCLKRGAYLTTPGWLADWPARMKQLGLNEKIAKEMFAETAPDIVLLDTGVDQHSVKHLRAFSEYVDRPYEIIYTGISVLRLLIVRLAMARQIIVQHKKTEAEIQNLRKQASTHAMAMDLLANLARIVNEAEAIEAMLDVYTFLFAPQRLCYLSFREKLPDKLWIKPEGSAEEQEKENIKKKLAAFSQDSAYTESGWGFILRIVRRGEVRGIIAVEDIAFPDYLDQYFNLALSIADLCELPIENARKYEKLIHTEEMLRKANENLHHLSTTDALTGIANRRAYDDYVEKEWKRMLRDNTPLSLIICDIDFFKKYNDRYGHEGGDVCLRTVAQIIRQKATRPGDFAARYGGEEFSVVLPDTSADGARHIAENIRTAVAQHSIPHEDSAAAPHVTLSLGVAQVQPPFAAELTLASLFRVADAALYEAKQQGRNRVVVQKLETKENRQKG